MKRFNVWLVAALVLFVSVLAAAFIFTTPKGALTLAMSLSAIAGMSFAAFHNIGAKIAAVNTGLAFGAVAGDAVDNAEQTGVIIDRLAHGNPLSASLIAQFVTTLAAGKKLFLGYRIEHGEAADLSDTADFATLAVAGNQVAVSAAGGTVTGVFKADFDLAGAKRYLRVNLTTNLDAAGVDTSAVGAVLVLGGEDREPAV